MPNPDIAFAADRAALKATLGIRPLARTVVIFGDSLESNSSGTGGAVSVNAQGLVSFASGYGELGVFEAGGRFELIANKGVSGNTLDDMLARFQTDVLDLKPDVVVFGGMINSITFGMSDAALAAELNKREQMLVRMLRAGILPVVMGCTHKPNCGPLVRRVRWYEHEMCRYYGVPYVDRYALMMDAATGDLATPYQKPSGNDNLHWNAVGNSVVGLALGKLLKGIETSYCPHYVAHVSNGGIGSADNLLANGSFALGTAGSLTGWNQDVGTETATLPAAALPSTGRLFNTVKTDTAQRYALTTVSGPGPGAGYAAGDVLHHAAKLTVSGINQVAPPTGYSVALQFFLSPSGASVQNLVGYVVHNQPLAEMAHRLTVPASTTATQMQFIIRDPGTYSLSNWTLVNATAMGAVWKPGQQAGYVL